MADSGRRCLIVERRDHLGGNSYTEEVADIQVHRYGPHIFHTSSEAIWNYVNRFATFLPFVYRGNVRIGEQTYSFPINLQTLQEVWGVTSPAEAERKLREVRVPITDPQNLEEWALSQVGEELYRLFIHGYTLKQWQREPRELPASILKRLPIRTWREDNYYNDRYQGIPQGGYTALFNRLLDGIEVRLGVDYLADRCFLNRLAHKIVYTGRIDQFFNCRFGELEYRNLRFESREFSVADYQGTAIINYPDAGVP
jgi:UDP-galactopyranose mutase